MGTITSRRRKDGSTGYTAQLRIMRDGVRVYQESQTFDRKQTAQAWLKKRETELAQPGALERAKRKGSTVQQMIARYVEQFGTTLGRTKEATLKAIGETWLGELEDRELTSQRLVEYGQWRMGLEGGGVQAQTVGNDLSHLAAVLSIARPAWGYEIDRHAMADARRVLKKMGMISKSKERDRRPEPQELDLLLEYFFEMQRRRPASINMPKIIAFAIFSTRRQEEITRIRWEDLDERRQAVLVRNMKNPGQKIGNHVWCHLPDEAWAILQSMPRECEEIHGRHRRRCQGGSGT